MSLRDEGFRAALGTPRAVSVHSLQRAPLVRIRGWVVILAVPLCLTGCSLFGKKTAAPTAGAAPSSDRPPPYLNTGTDRRDPPTAETVSSRSQINGVLAGQVLDRFNHRQTGVYIQVVDLEDTRQVSAAPIEKPVDDQGYFTIVGLRPGNQYQLIARVKDGDRVLSGKVVVVAPNPRISIFVSEDATTPNTPPLPAQPRFPTRVDDARRPAASLEAPIKDFNPPPQAGSTNDVVPPTTPVTTPANPPDPARTVDSGSIKNGFQQVVPSPTVDVPGNTLPPLPTLPRSRDTGNKDDGSKPSGPGLSSRAPPLELPVPSCQLVGKHLVNFALPDENGATWEFRKERGARERTGRLTLIDFCFSTCRPCLEAFPHLAELQKSYGPWGLDVVGVFYESGQLEDQVRRIRSVRGRYGIRYPTLLGSGNNCPVKSQFGVVNFPTLVLLDENGDIIWRSEGLDERGYYELLRLIRQRLRIADTASAGAGLGR